MQPNIEDYAVIGDRETAALVSRDGSIDWLCLPRFDSPACFAALLGDETHGRWRLGPSGEVFRTCRRYREGTLVLETDYETNGGVVRVTDCMPERAGPPLLLRLVQGLGGSVAMDLEIILRFDYGSIVPWVRKTRSGLLAVAGPDAVHLQSDVALESAHLRTGAHFIVGRGESFGFALEWSCSFAQGRRERLDVAALVRRTSAWWRRWSSRTTYEGPHRDAVVRSLVTLKALTYAPSGAIVAAPTTSLPEQWGGSLNWDYRYCWLRDATFTLYAFMNAGYSEEAAAWRDWLLRVVAGSGSQVRAMYSVLGERRVPEVELRWLPGFHGAVPVRTGNAANDQLQLDILGEVADAFFLSARAGLDDPELGWSLHTELVHYLEGAWRQPDSGMWEIRGTRRDFVHSKVMAWVAFDRSVKLIEGLRVEGPLKRWRKTRDAIHDEVCRMGYDSAKRTFVQYYGARQVDASALLMPLVGFLPISDPRIKGTVRAIEKDLLLDGLVRRYGLTEATGVDVLGPSWKPSDRGEGCFLPCSFWLADVYLLSERRSEAEALFDRLLSVSNDVGLFAEEYDPLKRRMLGNFPQAFTHVALVNTAHNLSQDVGPARHRLSARAPRPGKAIRPRPKRATGPATTR